MGIHSTVRHVNNDNKTCPQNPFRQEGTSQLQGWKTCSTMVPVRLPKNQPFHRRHHRSLFATKVSRAHGMWAGERHRIQVHLPSDGKKTLVHLKKNKQTPRPSHLRPMCATKASDKETISPPQSHERKDLGGPRTAPMEDGEGEAMEKDPSSSGSRHPPLVQRF